MKIRNNSNDDISSWTEALDLVHSSEILFRLYPKTFTAIYQENKWKTSNRCSHTLQVFTTFTKANSMVLWRRGRVLLRRNSKFTTKELGYSLKINYK